MAEPRIIFFHALKLAGLLLLFALMVPGVWALTLPDDALDQEDALLALGVSSGSFDELAPPEDPAGLIRELGFRVPRSIRKSGEPSAGDDHRPISYGAFSLLAMQFFDIPGGLMYRLLPVGFYALQELQYLGLIDDSVHSHDLLDAAQAGAIILELEALRDAGGIR